MIIGSAVYMGYCLDPAKELVNRFRVALTGRPVWLFSSGPAGKPSSKLAQSMDQDPADLPAMAAATHAQDHRRFAGKLDRKHLSLPQRGSLLVFRGLNGDFRDWADIRQWAEGIAWHLALAPQRPQVSTFTASGAALAENAGESDGTATLLTLPGQQSFGVTPMDSATAV